MPGQTLHNRYHITALIGQGAMGDVYEATDTQSGETVAVKVLARQLSLDEQMVERFRVMRNFADGVLCEPDLCRG